MAKRVLSPSAINLYFQCPRRFYYRYILGLPSRDSIHTVRGSAAHTVLENFFDIEPEKLTNLNYKKILHEHISVLFKEEWENSQKKLLALDLPKDQLDYYYDDTTIQLDKWLNIFLNQLEKKLKEVFLIKKAWKYFYPKHRELKLISNNLGVLGFLDQVLTLGDRNLIIDFKTSASPKISSDYQLQMTIYHILYKEKYQADAETYLWFLKFGLKRVPITNDMIVDAKFKIETVKKALDSKNILDYPKKESGLCKWCNQNGSGECDFYGQCMKQQEL